MTEQCSKEPLMVTIRCITYNHEPYIRQCLEGFVMQKTNFRFEAIVHDDASTDGTADIIREFADKYPDIIKPIFETENQYSKHDGSIRRIMDAHTHGKYVAICEGDDYWIDPLKLQKQVDFMEAHLEYTLCFHSAKVIGNSEYRTCCYTELREKDYSAIELFNNWIIPTASVLYRNGIKIYTDKRFIVGDNPIFLSCAKNGKIRCISNQPMSIYRQVTGSAVSRGWNWKEQIEHFEAIEEHFTDLGITDLIKDKISYIFAKQILISITKKSKGDLCFVLKFLFNNNFKSYGKIFRIMSKIIVRHSRLMFYNTK